MQIEQNRAVALDYRVSLPEGITVDASTKETPLWYVHGRNNLLPAFEKNVEGLAAGEKISFTLKAKDAYGELNPELIVEVDKWNLARTGQCIPGERVTVTNKSGQEASGRIIAVEKNKCRVDLNHELAGKDLTFDITVKEVRSASQAELTSGRIVLPPVAPQKSSQKE